MQLIPPPAAGARTTLNDTDTPIIAGDTTNKWIADFERRAIRASVDPHYADMMPLGVRLRANMIRARLTGGAA
ncbi:MAG: hypothetical protein EPN51_11970 [Mycobacterium sp.]|nr:MAG: hypothetical protein EPN51_11970 [Mycobacterium sp.]